MQTDCGIVSTKLDICIICRRNSCKESRNRRICCITYVESRNRVKSKYKSTHVAMVIIVQNSSLFLKTHLSLLRVTLIILLFCKIVSPRARLCFKATCRILSLSSSQESLDRYILFPLFSSSRTLRERERVETTQERKKERKKDREREKEQRDWIRWGVNFILANQGTGWSRSALSSAVGDEKKITKSTTIRFLDCQSSVRIIRSVKLIPWNRYSADFICYFVARNV